MAFDIEQPYLKYIYLGMSLRVSNHTHAGRQVYQQEETLAVIRLKCQP